MHPAGLLSGEWINNNIMYQTLSEIHYKKKFGAMTSFIGWQERQTEKHVQAMYRHFNLVSRDKKHQIHGTGQLHWWNEQLHCAVSYRV